MKRTTAFAAVLVACACALMMSARGYGETPYAIKMFAGDVKIISGGKASAAAVDRVLADGDTIVTGKNSLADVSFGDRGLVRVQESTRLTVASLKKSAGDPDLDLAGGGILVMLTKLVKGESYQVRTNTQVAAVRGTSFQVTADGEGSQVDVLSGKILVNPVADGTIRREIQEYVSENQSLRLNRNAVREIIAKRRKMVISELKKGDLDRLAEKFHKIRDSRGYKRLNRGLRGEIEKRVNRIKKRRADRTGKKISPAKKRVIKKRMRMRRSTGR
ncbi:MAG: FecR domain-containing protein [Spirochaetes bacterium]|nr:FecR domain-containing protein [Spirochaetota bacterium]